MENVKVNKLLKQAAKTVVCLLLCVALVWGYSYKEPTQAHASSAVIVAGGVIVMSAFLLGGVQFAASLGNQDAQNFCDNLYQAKKDIIDKNVTTLVNGSQMEIQYGQDALQAIYSTYVDWSKGIEYRKELGDALQLGQLDYTNVTLDTTFYKNLFQCSSFYHTSYGTYSSLKILATFDDNFTSRQLSFYALGLGNLIVENTEQGDAQGGVKFRIPINGTSYYAYTRYLSSCQSDVSTQIGRNKHIFAYGVLSGSSTGHYIIMSCTGRNDLGFGVFRDYFGSDTTAAAPTGAVNDDNEKAMQKAYYNGYSLGVHTADEVVQRLIDKLGKTNATTGNTYVTVTNTGSTTGVDSQNRVGTQEQVSGSTAVASDAEKAAADAANAGRDTSLPKPGDLPDLSLPMLLTRKFPFSLPWDLYASVKMLAATPTTPIYTIPFIRNLWGINQDITIDMTKFEPVAAVCRWGFSAMWVVGLIFLTRKLIWK
jgi:hypothetical protein